MCSSLAAENPDDYLWDRLWVNGGDKGGGVNGYVWIRSYSMILSSTLMIFELCI
jgi:hypothetical protein